MKKIFPILAAMLTALSMLTENVRAQTPQTASTFSVAGDAGEAPILGINGRSYIDIEALARLTHGSLTFKNNRTTLTLPGSIAGSQASAPHPSTGLSRAFVQSGIEELSSIREWRSAIFNAVQNNNPVSDDWISAHHHQAEKNLSLASAAASTDDDRSACTLLSAEFNNMQKLSDLYLAMRKQASFISPDTFNNDSLEAQILNCAKGFVSMTESREFLDQADCH
jgi:hypothetical protein